MRSKLCCLLLLCGLVLLGSPARAQAPATDALPAAAQASSDEAHAALQRVLARREFQDYHRQASPNALRTASAFISKLLAAIVTPIKRFFSWLERLLERIRPRETGISGSSFAFGQVWRVILYIVLLGAILFLLGVLVNAVLSWRRIRKVEQELDEGAEAVTVRRKQEPSYWERSLQQVDALWQTGNQREALRLLYRACLVLLDARGVLRFDESRANGEVLRELRRQGRAPVQQALRPIVRAFDRSWYGFLPVSGEEYTEAMASSRQFRDAVVEGRDA